MLFVFIVCPFKFYHNISKTQDKNVNIFRTKRGFNMKQKTFFIFLGFQLSEIVWALNCNLRYNRKLLVLSANIFFKGHNSIR